MPVRNTLAYYEHSLITDEKSFITSGPGRRNSARKQIYFLRIKNGAGRVTLLFPGFDRLRRKKKIFSPSRPRVDIYKRFSSNFENGLFKSVLKQIL